MTLRKDEPPKFENEKQKSLDKEIKIKSGQWQTCNATISHTFPSKPQHKICFIRL